MKTNNLSTIRNNQKHGKQETKSYGTLRLFSVVMLLLMVLTSFGRIARANHPASPSGQAPTPQAVLASGGGTAARVLNFHREDRGARLCEDLVITAVGDAIYSTCGNGVEKQYSLSEIERAQVQTWIETFQAVNYDRKDTIQADGAQIQLYVDGQGSQLATDAETQQMIDFAAALVAKIASH